MSDFEASYYFHYHLDWFSFSSEWFQKLVLLLSSCSLSSWKDPLHKFLGRSNQLVICKMIIMRARGVFVCFLKGLLRGFFVWVYILKHISFLHWVDTMNGFGYHEWFHFQRSKWQHMRIVFPLSLSTNKIWKQEFYLVAEKSPLPYENTDINEQLQSNKQGKCSGFLEEGDGQESGQ